MELRLVILTSPELRTLTLALPIEMTLIPEHLEIEAFLANGHRTANHEEL